MDFQDLFFAFLAALAAGFTNAIAGGGTLISFPALTALGLPAIVANISNTIALCPGYLGGIFSQRKDFKDQYRQLLKILPFTIAGSIIGGLLLLHTSEKSFRTLVPFLIFFATSLLALQNPIKRFIQKHQNLSKTGVLKKTGLFFILFLTAIYGGYFGAGISVIVFSVLSLVSDDSPHKINVLKQMISFSINITAALYFCFSSLVNWQVVFIMIFGSVLGGFLGGKTAGKMNPVSLKWVIVSVGFIISLYYFLKA